MKASIATSRLALAAAGMATFLSHRAFAQDSSLMSLAKLGLPDCAVACSLPYINITGIESDKAICDSSDKDCMCENPDFLESTASCVAKQCTVKEALSAKNLTTTNCDSPVRDKSHKLLVVAAVFSSISGFFVIQRFGVKITSPDLLLGLDDWMILLAAFIQAPCAAIASLAGSKYGLGQDIWTLTPHQITKFAYFLYIYTTIYFLNIAVCKLAFLLFYLRVFPAPRVRQILWATVAFVSVYGIAFLFLNGFQCTPISHYWHRWDGEHEGKCLNASHIAWAHASISIGLDFWNVAIPLYQLKGVSLDWKKKLGVALMFSVGLFTTIISIVRLAGLIEHDWSSSNQSWVKLDLAVWSTIEANCAIICACLPSFRSLLVRLFPNLHLGMATHRDRTHDKAAEDFYNGNHNLGFGTISRSVAEKTPGKHVVIPGAIAMSRTYKVETESTVPKRASGSTAEHGLITLPSLEEFDSSASTLDGRRDTLEEVRRRDFAEDTHGRDTSSDVYRSDTLEDVQQFSPEGRENSFEAQGESYRQGHRRQYSATTDRFDRGDFGRRDTFNGHDSWNDDSATINRRFS